MVCTINRPLQERPRSVSWHPQWLNDVTLPVPMTDEFQTQITSTRVANFIMGLIDGKRSIDDMAEENGPLMVFPGTHRGPILEHHSDGVFVGAVDLTSNGLNVDDATRLMGPAGSISIHHGRVLHGSALNTSNRDRRMLFFEIMAADAFPVMGSMTTFDGIEDYDERMLCGRPTLEPRLDPVPVRIPLPQPAKAGSIYEVQSGLKARSFKKV